MTDTSGWTPEEHINRACELTDVVENQSGDVGQDRYDLTIALARLHVELALAKERWWVGQ